jgi:hypothetical protein
MFLKQGSRIKGASLLKIAIAMAMPNEVGDKKPAS